MKHIFATIAILAVYAHPALAQGTPPPYRETTLELLQLVHADSTIKTSLHLMLDIQLKQHPELEPFQAAMRQFMEKYLNWNYLEESYAEIYERAFTEAEMQELIAFYRTPVGQKVLSVQPELIKQSAALGERTVLQHRQELEDLMMRRGEEIADARETLGLDATDDVFSVATGKWGWPEGNQSCEHNPESITFSMDKTIMTLTFDEPIEGMAQWPQSSFIYKIQEVGPTYVRAAIVGETRKTDTGESVVWDLVLKGRNAFCWHRTDWADSTCTKPLTRCPQ